MSVSIASDVKEYLIDRSSHVEKARPTESSDVVVIMASKVVGVSVTSMLFLNFRFGL